MGKKEPKYAAYVVKRGREPGIVRSWEECEKRVAGFSNAEFKGYETMYLAEQVWNEHVANTPQSSASSLELQPATDFHSLKGAGTKRARPYVDLTLDDSPVKPAKMLRRDTSDEDGFDTAIPLSLAPKQEVRYPKLPHEFTYPTTPFTSKLEVNYPTLPTTSGPTESPYFQSITAYVPEDIYAALKDTEEDNLRSKDEDDFERDKTIVLTQEQQAVVDMAVKGHNIFLTGAAGCGKTATLRKILGQFREKRRSYQVVAPTGIAALALNGKTAHSFMGWSPDSLCKPLTGLLLARQHAKKVASIEKIDVLIIEEISMVENQFLERMNHVLQAMMDTPEPMGGKQVILLGDFYQLPPVKPFQYCMNCGANMKERLKVDNVTCYNCENPKCKGPAKRLFSKGDQWAFKSKAWQDLNLQHVKLDRIHRQKSGHFQGILNKVRDGIMLTEEEWKQMEATKDLPRGICPVKLMSRKADVENCNLKALEAIRFSPVSWKAVDTCWRARSEYENVTGDLFAEEDNQPWEREDAFQGHRFSKSLTLKVGAKVVLLKNLDMEAGLVNGSQGVIISFKPVDPEDKPEEGGRHRPPWERDCLSAWRKENPQEPVVRFANGLKRIIPACASVSRKGTWQNPYMACRIQIPLTLGWALTIHKSQGMTLEFVEVSKKNIFEAGQLYVALSRATSLEGLVLTGYDRKQLAGDNDVIDFYNTTDWNAHLRITKASHRRRK